MIIAKINRFFAKHGTIAYGVLIVAMIAPLVFLYGARGCSAAARRQMNPTIGTVGGKAISRRQFFDELRAVGVKQFIDPRPGDPRAAAVRQLMFRGSFNTGNAQLLQLLAPDVFDRICALDEARRQRLDRVTDEELRAHIQGLLLFQNEGHFDRKRFDQVFQIYLQPMGITRLGFDQVMRESIAVERLERQVSEAVVVSDDQVFLAYQEDNLKATAQVARYNAFSYLSEVKVDRAEVKEYFDAHVDKYRVPDQVRAQVAVFSSAALEEGPSVSDEEIAADYEKNKATLYEREQIHTEHLLVRTTATMTPAEKAEKRQHAEDLHAKLVQGGDFAALARENSDDPVTRDRGGDMGFFARGRMTRKYEEAAFSLADGELSDVVDTPVGFYIIKRLAGRKMIPLADVESQIRSKLMRQKDEAAARGYYDEHLKDEFSGKQVRIRQLMKQVPPGADEDTRKAQREAVEALRERLVKNPALFPAVAREQSDDKLSARQGGDVGFFAKDDAKRKAVAEAAFSLKMNELSEIIETPGGFYLIQKIGERDEIPFSEAKAKIVGDMRRQRRDAARDAAQRQAVDFSVSVFRKLESTPPESRVEAFVKAAAEHGIEVMESGFFSSEDTQVPNIPGSTKALAQTAGKLSAASFLSNVVDGYSYFYVACWIEDRPGYVPDFTETMTDKTGDDIEAPAEPTLSAAGLRAQNDLKNERAQALALAAAKKDYEAIQAKLKDGATFADAKDDVAFTATGEFDLRAGPRVANGDRIKAIAEAHRAPSLAAPGEIPGGAVLVFVASHISPGRDQFEGVKQLWSKYYRRTRQLVALAEFYARLKERAGTELTEDWRFLLEEREKGDAAPDAAS